MKMVLRSGGMYRCLHPPGHTAARAASLHGTGGQHANALGNMKTPVVTLLTLLAVLWSGAAASDDRLSMDVLADVESQAITMIKDSDGFLWIGTYVDGVYRYDGKRLKHYNQASGLIRANSVPAILEDRHRNLWFAASGGGLSRFDKETNRIDFYGHDPDDPKSLSSGSFFWAGKHIMIEDRDGFLWVGTTGGGLNRFDPATGSFAHFRHDPGNPESLSSDNVRAVFQDREGFIWVGTEQGLDRLDPQTGSVTRYQPDPDRPETISGRIIISIFQDSAGILWVGTENKGLNRFDRETATFVHYRYDEKNPESLASDRVTEIFEDDRGILWLSHENRLTLFDRRRQTFRRHDGEHPDITRLLRDPETGRVWALTDSGKFGLINRQGKRFRLYRPEPDNPNSLASEIVVTIYEDASGILWIGCLGGLTRYDPATERFTVYKHEPGNPASVPSTIDYMPGIFEDSSGTFWIGSSMPAALSIFDRKTGTVVKTFRHDPADPHSLPDATQVNVIIEDRDDVNIFWIATANGLVRFDKRTERFATFGRNDSWDVHQDGQGILWLATWGNGLARFDKTTCQFSYFRHDPDDPTTISDNTLVPLFAARNGTFWIGTENGLNRFDPETGRFERYTRSGGYPWDAVHSIGEDAKGHLWLGTNDGLARFNPENGWFRRYTKSDGIQGSMFYANNGITSRDGRMWFGGTKGMNSFFPDQVTDNPHRPPVRLTAITQGGIDMDFGKAPERLQSITLDWRNNFFEFEFAALDYANPGKNRYAYKLEGLDRQWYLSGSRNFGRYAGLSPGSYTLRLRGSNNDGVWNETGQALKIIVLPPFWKTGWFYFLMALTGALAAGAVAFYMVQAEPGGLRTEKGRHRTGPRQRSPGGPQPGTPAPGPAQGRIPGQYLP